MNQHIPSVTRADVERIISRDFSSGDFDQIANLLSLYGTESYHKEVDRLHLDIMKLVNGDIERLSQEIDNACCDYRDSILAAEYPNYAKNMFQPDDVDPKKQKLLIKSDKEQYEEWLNR